ncbi:MAG: hypothetical protein GXP05_14830, partial [Alphaproteobacteria bacterium]|nr:hypothetical protein [Alphaproteobacteria bacterium]
MTPPPLMPINAHGGEWARYEAALYDVFVRDIIRHDLRFRGIQVNARRIPEHERKWACFWHMISEGSVEDDRIPDMRRCERLSQVRWIIENADAVEVIDIWEQTREREKNWVLWYEEFYLVVLAHRSGYYLLKTAFCTDRDHQVRKFRKERDAYYAGGG